MVLLKTRLKQILEERGIKHVWLREQVGVSQSQFTRIVNGTCNPSLPVAIRIARVLGMRVEDIWWEE